MFELFSITSLLLSSETVIVMRLEQFCNGVLHSHEADRMTDSKASDMTSDLV